MAADNEIVIEALARIEQAREALKTLAADAKRDIADIPARKEIELETKKSEGNLKRLEGALEELYDKGAKVTKINLPVDDAIAGVDRLRDKVDAASADAAGPLQSSFKTAAAAVADFGDRSDQSSKKFGRGFENAGVKSRLALKDLRREIEATRASGGPVAQRDLDRLDQLEKEYQKAERAAHEYRLEQREVAQDIGRVTSLNDALEKQFPAQARAVGKAILVWETLKTTYNETREALDKLKSLGQDFGVDLDVNRKIQESFSQSLNDLGDKAREAGDDAAFLANAENILNKRGIEYQHTAEGIRKAFSELGDELRDVELKQQGFVDSILETKEAAENEAKSILAGIAEIQRRGEVTAGSAAAIASSLGKVNEALARLGANQPALVALQKEFERIAEAFKLDEAIDAIDQFAKKLVAGGKVSREQADSIVSDIDRQIKQIRTLPNEEQEAYKVRLRVLTDYRDEFAKFTTAYAAELAKQRKALEEEIKREEATLLAFSEKLKTAFQVPKVEGPDTSDIKAKLAAAREELAKLQAEPTGSIEDSNRIEELKAMISDLETDLSRLGVSALDAGKGLADLGEKGRAGADQAKQAILDLLSSSEEFKATFQKLPVEFQQAIEGLVSGFVTDLESGLADGQSDVQRFIEQFSGLLKDGGAVSDEFAGKLRALAGADTGISDLFAALKKGADDSVESVRTAGTVAGDTGEAYIRLAKAADQSGTAQGRIREEFGTTTIGTAKLKEQVIELSDGELKAHDNTIKWRGEIVKIPGAVDAAAPKIALISGHTSKVAVATKEWAAGLAASKKQLIDIVPLLAKMAEYLERTAVALPKANPANVSPP